MQLSTTHKTESDLEIERIAKMKGMTPAIVRAILGDCANQKVSKESQAVIAARWGVPFGNVTSCRNMGKVTIEEIRSMAVSKSVTLMDAAQDIVMDKLQDPEAVAKMSAKDASVIAKQQADMALNLSNNSVGAGNITINAIGDVKALIQMKVEAGASKSAAERLAERGVNVEKILSEASKQEALEAEVITDENTNPDDDTETSA